MNNLEEEANRFDGVLWAQIKNKETDAYIKYSELYNQRSALGSPEGHFWKLLNSSDDTKELFYNINATVDGDFVVITGSCHSGKSIVVKMLASEFSILRAWEVMKPKIIELKEAQEQTQIKNLQNQLNQLINKKKIIL